MIHDFDDFCLWMYVVVDEIWQRTAWLFRRPGPAPVCSDSELLTMALVGECRGWDIETEMLCQWREHRDLFPTVPTQSRFNRRRRNLMYGFNMLRQVVLGCLDVTQDQIGVIDSLPVPAVAFHLVPGSSADWQAHGATFGRIAAKKQVIFGYRLHLLITLGGVILDFELAPANVGDLAVGCELLAAHTDLTVLGDKGYIGAAQAAELWQHNRIDLCTLPRRNQKRQLPAAVQHRHNALRQIVETVNDQLTEQFHVEINHAHTFWGLCTRLYTKLTAHTLCIYLNRLLGNVDFLHIKTLAFPA
jgi:IS5 family transposase